MNELPLLCVHEFGFIRRYVDKQRTGCIDKIEKTLATETNMQLFESIKFVNLFYLAGIQMGTIGRKWETE